MKYGVYIVYVGSKVTQPCYNKRKAIRFARKHPGAEVYGMSRDLYNSGGMFGWDYPTFKITAERIYS